MAWNSTHTSVKSSYLTDLDCSNTSSLKGRVNDHEVVKIARIVTPHAMEVGECIAMIRVPRGALITGMRIAHEPLGTSVLLGVGDPFACARFLGPVLGTFASGRSGFDCTGWECTVLSKTGNVGDGCGLYYVYTCETDILVTNLYGAGSAAQGGWVGGTAAASASSAVQAGGTITASRAIVLEVRYLNTQA